MDACACGPGSSSPTASSSRAYPSSTDQCCAPSIRSSATYGAGAAPCTASSTAVRARRKIVSAFDQSGSGRSSGRSASSSANASDSSTNSTGANSRSAMPSSRTSAALSIRFWRSGFDTITLIATSGPTRRGSSCVPPQAGKRPRKTSGNAKWRTALETVRALQCSASSTPPPRHAPLTAATVGNGSARIRANSAWPTRLPSRASSASACGNSFTSAPAENQNGLPVTTRAAHPPRSSSGSTRSSDANAPRPKNGGCVWSAPSSIVSSATSPARASLNAASAMTHVLPEDCGAHAHSDAEGGEAVADGGTLAEAVGELRHQPHARRGERMPAGDRAAVGVQPFVVRVDAEPVAPGEHLHGERLVQLEEADVVERQPGLFEHPLRRGNRAEPHQLGLDAGERKPDKPHR